MTEFSIACSLSDLAEGRPKACNVSGHPVTVIKAQEKVFAVDSTCPHRGGPLAEGFVADDCIVCPWHGWGFHLESGMYVGSPGVGVRTHQVEIRDGSVFVRVG